MGKRQNAANLTAFGTPPLGGSGLVLVSSADTTPGFLEDKLVAGTNISFVILNPGADEQLEIIASDTVIVSVETGANLIWATLSADVIKNNSTNAWTLTLPALADLTSAQLKFITIFAGLVGSGGTITVSPLGGDTIDGAATLDIVAGQSRTIFPFSAEYNTV